MFTFAQTSLECFAVTDIGKVRKNNEDAVLSVPEAGCFIVSDGMGGGKAGEVASAMMVNETEKIFTQIKRDSTPGEREGEFIRAAYRINFNIRDYAEDHNYASMGATVVALILDPWCPDTASVFHAGDSRAYRIRNEKLEQLMEDHSVAASNNIDEKKLAPMFRGVLTNALGTGNDFYLERTAIDIQEDDLFLLCSDGLTRMVSDSEILQIFNTIRYESAENIVSTLLKAALERGGRDNVSVIGIRIKKIGSAYTPDREESKRNTDAQMRNLTDLTDTAKTEIVCDSSIVKKLKE